MLFIMSPTKTMIENLKSTEEIQASNEILQYIQTLTIAEISNIFKVNEKIAQQTYEYYKNFNQKTTAIYGYSGIQYKQLSLSDYTDAQLQYLQEHVRILSALYGVVKPFDVINLYRLEMQTKFKIDLYQYWKPKITDILKHKQLIILASDEYAKLLESQNAITIQFATIVEGKIKRFSTASKIARGKFLDVCVHQRITEIENLKVVEVDGFKFSEKYSTKNEWYFIK